MTTFEHNALTEQSVFIPLGFVDISATLDGGQAFRWHLENSGYRGVIGRRVVHISEVSGGVEVTVMDGRGVSGIYHSASQYLGLGQDLDGFAKRFANDPCLGPALIGYPGIRVLRQDPWECLFSFITSSTSNIARIKLNVGSAAEKLGYSIGPNTTDVVFPEPEVIVESGEQYLRDLGFGFRAKYLVLCAGQLNHFDLRECSYTDARTALTQLHGVGEKIADCVLAFSLDKPESFIVDRHILRALRKWYGLSEKCSLSYASEWARDHFGEYSALANQYMFHRERLSARAIAWGGPHVDRALPEDGV